MKISSLEQLIEIARSKPKKRLVVAAAADETVLSAINMAYIRGLIQPVLIGDASHIKKIISLKGLNSAEWEIIDEKDSILAVDKAIEEIKSGRAEILMKGLVGTAPLLRAILDKKNGLKKNELLSHVALFQSSYYHKVFGFSDGAMNINPDVEDKRQIINNITEIFHKLGNPLPKVAVLGPVEFVNEKIQSTLDAAKLKELNQKNEISGCLVDGPLALDNAISADAARQKRIVSPVAGDADILIVPDLNSGNILYKSLVFLSDATSAAIITGAEIPVVLTSRADNEKSKLYSLALAAAL